MCLKCKKQQIKIAESDIECYKVVEKRGHDLFYRTDLDFNRVLFKYKLSMNDIKYVTPYYRFPVAFGKEFREDDFLESVLNAFDDGEYDDKFVFGMNMFHSYSNLSRKLLVIESPVFVKCVIPKGSKYIEGVDDCGEMCYGSEKIIYKEIIDY